MLRLLHLLVAAPIFFTTVAKADFKDRFDEVSKKNQEAILKASNKKKAVQSYVKDLNLLSNEARKQKNEGFAVMVDFIVDALEEYILPLRNPSASSCEQVDGAIDYRFSATHAADTYPLEGYETRQVLRLFCPSLPKLENGLGESTGVEEDNH